MKKLNLMLGLLLLIGFSLNVVNGEENIAPRKRLYGLNYSPYMDGQNPKIDPRISEKQILSRLNIVAPYTEWIRTFGCTNGMEKTGKLAHRLGLKAAIGAWLDFDAAANEKEVENLVKVGRSGDADILIVGNEALFHQQVTEDQMINYLQHVKKEVPNIPVTTVDIYNIILRYPNVAKLCDVIMINCYPFWEKRDIREALPLYRMVYQQVKSRYGGKTVVFAEVGWPSGGKAYGKAVPSLMNAQLFFRDFTAWARVNNIPYYYFEAFDESWKVGDETEIGSTWGIWDQHGNPKWDLGPLKNQ